VAEVEGSIMMSRIFNDNSYIKNTHKRLISRLEKGTAAEPLVEDLSIVSK